MSKDSQLPCDILIFSSSFNQGGAERLAVTLANLLVKRWQVQLLSISDDGPFKQELSDDVDRINLNKASSLVAIPSLVKHLKVIRPKVVFCSQSHLAFCMVSAIRLSGIECSLVAREASCPSVNLAGIKSSLVRSWVKWSGAFAYKRADLLVAPARYVADDVQQYFGITADIKIVANPLDGSFIQGLSLQPCEHAWVKDAKGYILAVGRLVPEKDYSTLLKALALSQQYQTIRLIILGEGPLRGELEAQAKQLGVEDLVSLVGFVSNPFVYMKHCKAFVLSSFVEGMPNALLQAQYLGADCISSDCPGGAGELLPKQNYFTVGDATALAKLIVNPPSSSQRHRSNASDFESLFEELL
ncbi:glycosyltransferase [Agarivorans sp. DSG3-1]|uniref:glycosyltransferase n=1 Tax=Agarivorans sp. DSG3-1 TaxID=3342249 RepID=UPI00398EF7C6